MFHNTVKLAWACSINQPRDGYEIQQKNSSVPSAMGGLTLLIRSANVWFSMDAGRPCSRKYYASSTVYVQFCDVPRSPVACHLSTRQRLYLKGTSAPTSFAALKHYQRSARRLRADRTAFGELDLLNSAKKNIMHTFRTR